MSLHLLPVPVEPECNIRTSKTHEWGGIALYISALRGNIIPRQLIIRYTDNRAEGDLCTVFLFPL
jgi:hypothetical protein